MGKLDGIQIAGHLVVALVLVAGAARGAPLITVAGTAAGGER
jgi:hypothetical protein